MKTQAEFLAENMKSGFRTSKGTKGVSSKLQTKLGHLANDVLRNMMKTAWEDMQREAKKDTIVKTAIKNGDEDEVLQNIWDSVLFPQIKNSFKEY